ncbi:MAG: tRNA epoxyqueuosine(34) reductase QueG [Rikenellaceae bacterium]
MLKINIIKIAAKIELFSLCGVAPVRTFEQNREHYLQWINSGRAQMLPYMAEHTALRFDATTLLQGAKSVVVCAVNYKSDRSLDQSDIADCKVASYALFRDYHKTIRRRLRSLLRTLQASYPNLKGRVCVDSAPILEKQYAVDAGLGWIGRQSLLVTPEHGTFILLGVLLLDMECDVYDSPLEGVGCAECRRCVDNCPAGAIQPTPSPLFNTIDSRRCISALTVESCNPDSKPLHGWLFGCDECQSCCPYNRLTPKSEDSEFTPSYTPPTAQQWREMKEEEFTTKFAATPLKRAGLERIKDVVN